MAVAAVPAGWPYRYRKALIVLSLLTFLGLLSLSAVRQMTIDCQVRDNGCLLVGGDAVTCLGVGGDTHTVLGIGGQTRECHVVAGEIRIPLSEWAEPVIRRFYGRTAI